MRGLLDAFAAWRGTARAETQAAPPPVQQAAPAIPVYVVGDPDPFAIPPAPRAAATAAPPAFSPATYAAAGLAPPFPMQDLVDLLRREEGVRLVVYDDATGEPIRPGSQVKGHPTIGIGRALDRRGVSRAEAEAMLASDCAELVRELPGRIGCWHNLTPARQVVLVAMAFQMGVDGLLGFRNTLQLLARGRYAEAAEGMLASLWAKQTPQRAARMATIMRRGTLA